MSPPSQQKGESPFLEDCYSSWQVDPRPDFNICRLLAVPALSRPSAATQPVSSTMSSVAMMASQDSVIMSATITKFLQLAQERALDDKISSLQGTVASLNDRTNKSETRISQVEADKTQLQNRIDDAEILISQTRADNTKLQDEITELRAQLSHAEDLFLQAGMGRILVYRDLLDPTDSDSRDFSCPISRRPISPVP